MGWNRLITTYLTYDDIYRKTTETVNYGAFSLATFYAYNKNGTKKSFTYPNNTTIEYTYDANNQIAGIQIPNAGFVSFGAYQWTRPTSITLPGGGKRQFSYDPLMRTKFIAGKDPGQNTLLNYQYGYDKMDNIKTRDTQAGNYAYNYDDLYRLNEVQKDTQQTENYTYDQVGNRLTSKVATGDWTYNNNNELLSTPLSSSGSTGGSSYVYDANGNTIQKNDNGNIQNYVYDVDNRLIEVKDQSNNTIAKYTYDPFGRRIKKELGSASPANAGGIVYYLYSDEGLIGEYDATGNEIKTYGYKPNSTWSTDPLFMREGGNIYFYHNDHLGTPQKLTNISGAVVWSATYDAFGKAAIDASSTITSNLRFPGQYFDAETGLHYNWHRYYDPNTGRYVTADPIGFEGGDLNLFAYVDSVGKPQTNLYQYTGSNPINYSDPFGLFAWVNPITYWSDLYNYSRTRRTWGHNKYPEETNSSMRHCVVSCIVAANFGSAGARVAGAGNEIQGFIMWDIRNIFNRLSGNSPWAFQWKDLMNNEHGINCSKKQRCNDDGNIEKNCIECCQGN